MQKLTEINIGGSNYNIAGCALTGVCATAAADYIKAVTLSDGENLFDGMAVIVAFANGNTAGNAPNAQIIYSSDQVNYYSDAELTQPFTLAPSGCYSIEYTGTGNAYTYLSYPIIQIGSITGRVCDGRGKPVAKSIWSAGDRVIFIYSGGDFFILPALTNEVAPGNTSAVTSNAVYPTKQKTDVLHDTNLLSQVSSLPVIKWAELPSQSTNDSTYFQEWYDYMIDHGYFGSGTKSYIGLANPNYLCTFWGYTYEGFDVKNYSSFIALKPTGIIRFGYDGGQWYCVSIH